MPAFVQVSEDQNSAVLWPERPLVLRFVQSRLPGIHECHRCVYCNNDRDDPCNLPCGLAANEHQTGALMRADGRVGYFERVE
jgi:hypothetical protein